MFIGRDKELDKLEKRYHNNRFECVVIYGRRRVGKTTLINKFCEGKASIYFTGIESSSRINLENLSSSIFHLTMPGLNTTPVFENYQKALDYLVETTQHQRIIVVIDEYPYLASSENSISSLLQTYIDQHFKNTQLFLILCGSSMSFMENQVLGYQSPLYGRRTAQFKILPFDYYDTSLFYPNLSPGDQALLYGITGGIPQYIDQFDSQKSMRQNIIDELLDDSAYLFEEPSNLLKQELREPQVYNSIITAIAKGSSRLNDISLKTGLMTSICSIYLKSLISLGIVEKQTPAGDEKSKKTIYSLQDNLFYFWHRFIASSMATIVTGKGEELFDHQIEPQLTDYMGRIFEKMCKEFLIRKNGSKDLPFLFTSIGKWWGTNPVQKCQMDIDLVASSKESKTIGFAECKYRNELLGVGVLKELVEKSLFLNKGYSQSFYFLFSKSGFTTEVKKQAKENPCIQLFDFDRLYLN
jgi:AAA+ ATPase superfamily predicted ATPase